MTPELHITLNRKTVESGQLPEATLRILNAGSETMVINGRMLATPLHTPDSLHEVTWLVTPPDGAVNLKRVRINSGRPGREDFVRLFPGEYIFQSYELSKYFSYKMPGKYKIRARYASTEEPVINGVRGWSGEIFSNEESFEVV